MIRIGQQTWRRVGLAATLVSGLFLLRAIFRLWHKRRHAAAHPKPLNYQRVDQTPSVVLGLTEDEAASLLPTIDREASNQSRQREFLWKVIYQNLFTIFNFNLFAMTVVSFLLDNPTGVFLNLLVLSIGLSLRTYQIAITKKRMDEILQSLRPQASVIRDGRLHSIDTDQVVPGDALVIGQGDEILVDGEFTGEGEITVEELDAAGKVSQARKRYGDALQAGSYCVNGRGVYISKAAGWQRDQPDTGYQFELMQGKRTSLQQLVENVLYILLAIVLILSSLLVLDALLTQTSLVSQDYRRAFAIIFGVAPTGLFMVLIFKNILGVLRISQRGGLVYDPRSIETLAQVETLCISKETLVSGLKVTVETVKSPKGQELFSEKLIRRILGDIVHSSARINSLLNMLAEALPGERRTIKEKASFLRSLGWYGITFEDPDLQGTYILGLQEVVEANLMGARRGIKRFLRRFSRTDGEVQLGETDHSPASVMIEVDSTQGETLEASQSATNPGWRQKLGVTLLSWLTPIEEIQPEQADQPEQQNDDSVLFFAYLPEPVSLYDREGVPELPRNLIPLAHLQVSEVVRPEARKALETLLAHGMNLKILAADPPEKVSSIARELGVPNGESSSVSSKILMDAPDLAAKVRESMIIGDLSPAQKAEIVRSLQEQEEHILMIGSSVGDVAALRQADLGMAPKNGQQAALRVSDIVILDDSIAVLPRIFSIGQQMLNGVLNILNLYLSQAIMQLLLILFLVFKVFEHFPYLPAQAGVASFFTIVIPNIFLVFWASTRRVTEQNMHRRLIHFIVPTALTMTILLGGIHILFSEPGGEPDYANLAVTYSLLLAGWLRVLFVQPPTPFWVGGAPLRGDPRVIRLVFGCALLLIGILLIPFFRESFEITLLASWADFFIIALAVLIWALALRTIWRLRPAG